MSSKQSLETPHKCRFVNCKGKLNEPRENYGTWAYWHGIGPGIVSGWHSKPMTEEPTSSFPEQEVINPLSQKTPQAILAAVVISTAKLHEESFDHAASGLAGREAEAAALLDPSNIYIGLVDHKQFYRLNLHEASELAAKDFPDLALPAYLALSYTWNDILDWACEVLNVKLVVTGDVEAAA